MAGMQHWTEPPGRLEQPCPPHTLPHAALQQIWLDGCKIPARHSTGARPGTRLKLEALLPRVAGPMDETGSNPAGHAQCSSPRLVGQLRRRLQRGSAQQYKPLPERHLAM